MSFQWHPRFAPEWPEIEAPPIWVYLGLYLVVELLALGMYLSGMPKGVVDWESFFRYAVAIPFLCWTAICFLVYLLAYDMLALQAAAYNSARWEEIKNWQWQNRSGVVVLDSVILTPEPDLAERMLRLEGSPPENPGRPMVLRDIAAPDGGTRLHGLLTALLAPLVARLSEAVESRSFDIVIQCDDEELAHEIPVVWHEVGLAGTPVVRYLNNRSDIGYADRWFDADAAPYWYASDKTPRYRLVLAWHLHGEGPDAEQKESEAAVAMLLGSPTLVYEKPKLKRQAWLLRQMTGEADQVDALLSTLLNAGQVATGSIRHFWHSRLKGLAQHATLGAVKEAGLKLDEHAIDPAIGPQAPVARWLLQALAAKMTQFGQGAQLVALPHEQGVSLNVVAKERAPADVQWKPEYGYESGPFAEFGMCVSGWLAVVLALPKNWDTPHTVCSWIFGGAFVVLLLIRYRRKIPSVMDAVLDAIGF